MGQVFKIVAREAWEGGAASAPITLTVVLNDINDNPPRLPVYPSISVQAGSTLRTIAEINATDNDAGENSVVRYTIHHISNNGKDKFSMNATTGLLALVGEVDAGDQYLVTVRATDKGGLSGQSIIEVNVNRGPNTGGPVFTLPRYSSAVSEGAAPNSAILTLTASDPEGDPARFSFVSGNELRHFDIGQTSGILRLVDQLDRENLEAYTLVVKAEDPEGMSNTATVSISVADINDKNPEFTGLPYSFRVNEGKDSAEVGIVQAEDEDFGANGEVFYSVPSDSLFTIDSSTGVIRTKQALDYEKEQAHYLVVTASDGAVDPRIATATVTVLVSDIEDEPPVFEQQVYEATVKENSPDTFLVKVEATDPDTRPKITYVIVNGNSQLFSIDPSSGRISTVLGLDYEEESSHTVVVGMLENSSGSPQATCSVLVTVEDINDFPPIFSGEVSPASVPEATPPGSEIASVLATDADGTKPNNLVEYEIVGQGNAIDFFEINKVSGVITLKEDLQTELDSNFELHVVAHDGGEPSLTATMTVSVFVERAVPEIKNVDVFATFSDVEYSKEVPEDLPVGTLVKKLTVLNTPEVARLLRCEIIKGNDNDTFKMELTEDRLCGIMLKYPLDYELQKKYTLTVALESPPAPPETEQRLAKVELTITDINDNEPEFQFSKPYSDYGSYYGFVADNAPISTSVLKVKAVDSDSGEFARIHYELVPESNRGGYFSIGATSGVIKTEKGTSSVPPELLPFNLTVLARDNNREGDSPSHTTAVSVIINKVQNHHRLVLVVENSTEEIKNKREELIKILQEHSNQLIGIEKIESRRYVGNGTIVTDARAADVWFHILDADTGRLLNHSHPILKKLTDSSRNRSTVLFYVTAALGVRAADIHPPLELPPVPEDPRSPVRTAVALAAYQIALIALAGVIVVLGTIGICCICLQWKRYVRHRDEASKAVVVVAPPYERVGSVIEPVAKEYEVQVLHMSVPMDDESVQDMPIDLRPSHHFSMDNVSYITKQQLSDEESSSSSRDGNGDIRMPSHIPHNGTVGMEWDTPPGQRHMGHMAAIGASASSGRNPAYEHFADDDEDGRDGPLSVSATNENVMFGRRGILDPSPVQTTTEL
ncbi:hypothetical protein SK128_015764 [Halocaridina rubra]|uniref:Cadherin domain-containing protein n=1 Tax=Halocaridina rubra TaxID=373956 RepID=A0AAN9ADD8_HALRR